MMTIGSAGMLEGSEHPTYGVEGLIKFTHLDTNARPTVTREHRFTCSVVGEQWLIRVVPQAGHVAEHIELGSDGTNVYRIVKVNENYGRSTEATSALARIEQSLQEATNESAVHRLRTVQNRLRTSLKDNIRTNVANDSVGRVYPGTVPRYDYDDAAPIWLAFASAGFIAGLKDARFPPVLWFTEPGVITEMETRAKYERFDSPPFLPKRIEFYREQRSTSQPVGIPRAILDVRDITNYAGLLLPLRFVITKYRTASTTDERENLSVSDVYECSLHSITTNISQRISRPELTGKTLLSDERFLREGLQHPVQYLAKEKEWPTKDSVRASAAYKTSIRLQAQQLRDSRYTPAKRIAIFIVFALVLLAPGLFWLRKLKRTGKQT